MVIFRITVFLTVLYNLKHACQGFHYSTVFNRRASGCHRCKNILNLTSV